MFSKTKTPGFHLIACITFLLCLTSTPFSVLSAASASSTQPVTQPGKISKISAAAALPTGAKTSERILGLAGLKNVGRVSPLIFRGAQPAPQGYATLKKMGIRTVLNLRTSVSEKQQVEAAGMKSVEIPIKMSGDVTREKINKIVAIMADPANQPVFVHCKLGKDRTGIVMAAYRMKVEGWPLTLAESEMESFGFNEVWINLKSFIRSYAVSL
jgi:tyrosine-protein phosphatase SIW14